MQPSKFIIQKNILPRQIRGFQGGGDCEYYYLLLCDAVQFADVHQCSGGTLMM
jgi:hypothetical protein